MPPRPGFAECLNNMTQGKVAMWYDATSAAGSLEAAGSPVKGKLGYVPAPVEKTDSSGWLYTWAWGMQKASRNSDKAWKFVSWASGKQYEQLVGETSGWPNVPAGKRASTYANADYRKSAASFQETTKEAIEGAKPNDPGCSRVPRPASSSSASPSSPISAPRSPRRSARPSPDASPSTRP